MNPMAVTANPGNARPPPTVVDDESFELESARYRREAKERKASILAAWRTSPAILVTESWGERLAILSGEMSTPEYGPMRATFLSPDGPSGHDVGTVDELATRLGATTVRPMGELEVMAWTSTSKYLEGCQAVAFIQADNAIRYLGGKLGRTDEAYRVLALARELFSSDRDAATAMLEQTMAAWPEAA